MTYSIVARDPETGDLGVAVQTHQPAVGAIVPWVKAGVGAVATQSFANINFGPQVLGLLEAGLDARAALTAVIAADTMPARRQLAVISAGGQTATHTGDDCIPFAGHRAGENYSVQANMMLTDRVPTAMAVAFESSHGPLAVRLMRALEAAQGEGGDIRGSQSAAILVRAPGPLSHTWDLRIDNDPAPLAKLAELIKIRLAGELVTPLDGPSPDIAAFLLAYDEADELAGSDEQTFWFAVRGLSPHGEAERAAALLEPLFARAPQWKELLFRLAMPEAEPLKARFTR
ncbi:MAG: Zn-dependent protease [Anaerolinea sp.]|nr:Zn-dependent protease [Anaerolinea sp.]